MTRARYRSLPRRARTRGTAIRKLLGTFEVLGGLVNGLLAEPTGRRDWSVIHYLRSWQRACIYPLVCRQRGSLHCHWARLRSLVTQDVDARERFERDGTQGVYVR